MSSTAATRRPARRRAQALLRLAALPLAGLAGLSAVALPSTASAEAQSFSPGLPPDTSIDVTPVASAASQLEAQGVAPLPAPVGFGAATTGGAGGQVVHVWSGEDSVSNPAPGTLRHALSLPGPKWVVFDADLTIALAAPLDVPSHTTVDGRGRRVVITGPGIAGLRITDAQNVVLESLELRDFGDTSQTQANDTDDAVAILRSSRVWIDHSSLSKAADKLVGIADGSTDITLSWNHFYEQQQTVQIGTLSTAWQDTATRVTLAHNHFDHVGYRLPVVSYAKAHVYNNYVDSWTVSAVRSQRIGQIYLESNVFRVAGSRKAVTVAPAETCNDGGTLCDERGGYLADIGNLYIGTATRESTGTWHVFDPRAAYLYSAEPATEDLAARIDAHAGALPAAATPPAQAQPSIATIVASLRGSNAKTGSDMLTVKTRQRLAATATVVVYRKTGKGWQQLKAVRLDKHGTARLAVRDRSRRTTAYRAVVKATGLTTADVSNVVVLR